MKLSTIVVFGHTGILVAKKSLFRNTVPNGCGGGTVFFVTQGGHRYLKVSKTAKPVVIC